MRESSDPDLILRVKQETLSNGQKALRFVPKTREPLPGLYLAEFDSPSLRRDPQDYFRNIFRDMESIPRSGLQDWLENQGANLFEELVPIELRRRLWALRDSVQTIQIVSDEVWIPWELLRLRDPDDPSSGRFLCEAFNITRWLLIESPPALHLPLQRLALVIPEDPSLPKSSVERERMKSFRGMAREVVEVPAIYSEVKKALGAGRYDGLHFAGHGFSWGGGRRRGFQLEERDELGPEHLQKGQLKSQRPLVFLNACYSGGGGASLTGIGGLASAFLEAGAGAFIGSHWELQDEQALCFAEELYRSLFSGLAIGEAARQARLALRDRFPGSNSWLAYTVFAHPLASAVGKPVKSQRPRAPNAPKKKRSDNAPPAPRRKDPVSLIEVTEPQLPLPQEPPRPPEPAPGAERIHEKDGTVLVYVPGGEVTLGAEGVHEWSRPVHRVRLSPFWISKVPVTNEQYERFLEQNPYVPKPACWDDARFNPLRHPVVGVSWDEALAYCSWAGLELPSEAQWEAAARGTDQRPYPWGREQPTPRHASFGGTTGTTPVETHPAGAGPYGTLDQAGNVWEWCTDPWSPTAYREREKGQLDPIAEGEPAVRALRGGSWNTPVQDLRAAYRIGASAKRRFNNQGFRCLWCPPA